MNLPRGWLTAGAGVVCFVALAVALAGERGADGASTAQVDQLARGQAVYAFSCTTCHGATGQGFAEARSVFPADHYDCFRCHSPRNPAQMTPDEIALHQTVFSLGDAPPLADPHALARFGTAAGLYGYVRATMPRWDPGRLDDEAYVDVVAFVLELAGLLPEGVVLTPSTMPAVPLGTAP